MDRQHIVDELTRLRAEVVQLREERIPRVDRSSRRRDRRLTYAYALVTAVAVGMAGLGTASALDGSDTVFPDDIVADAVTSAKLLDGSVTGLDVRAVILSYDFDEPEAITFPQRLPATFDASHVEIPPPGATTTHCPTPGHAAPGWICVYRTLDPNAPYPPIIVGISGDGLATKPDPGQVSPWGFRMWLQVVGPGTSTVVSGSWAATAP